MNFNSEMEVYVSDQYFGDLVKIESIVEQSPEFTGLAGYIIKSADKMKIRIFTDVGSVLISKFNYYKGPEGERIYIPEEWVLEKPTINSPPTATVGVSGTIWSKDWKPSHEEKWAGDFENADEGKGPSTNPQLDYIKKLFPGAEDGAHCPIPEKDACGLDRDHYTDHVYNLVMHLNDHHMWSREEIADWLESLDIDLDIAID